MLDVRVISATLDCRTSATRDFNAARARLAAANARYQRDTAPLRAIYYPPTRKETPEEPVEDIAQAGLLDGLLTRNHYGSLVLNAHHALFIDVDMPDSPENGISEGPLPSSWIRTFDDLRTVLSGESHCGFRIYRTAAGFRILGVTQEFEPGSDIAKDLMISVGADDAFIRLCGTQRTFRARLTPKPWRCGTIRPPNDFPRQTPEERGCFDDWLRQYDRLCRGRATCRFLGQVGSTVVHERVAPIIDFHDQQTKAFAELALA